MISKNVLLSGTGTVASSVEDPLEKLIKVYPNPAKTELTVELPEILIGNCNSVEITDLHGARVKYTNKISSAMDFDISGLSPGGYFVRIGSGDKEIVKKIIMK